MKIEVGKYYRTRDGRKVGPIGYNPNITNYGKFFSGETFWDEFGRLYQATKETDHDLIAEWTEPETGTLAELDVKPGDVVEWFNTSVVNPMEVISASIITSGAFEGQVEAVLSGYGSGIFDVEQFRIISRASDTPKTSSKSWPHNGEWSNWFMSGVDGTIKNSLMRGKECEVETQKLAGCKQFAYRFRIKPEPVRETVTMQWSYENGGQDGYAHPYNKNATHRITFTTTDGKPDLDSIKMEEV